MSKNNLSQGFSTVIIVIIAAVVLIGAVAFTMNRGSSPSGGSSSESDRGSVDIEESGVLEGETTSTLPDIIGYGQNLECEWELPTDEGAAFGTGRLYTAGNRGRSMMTGNSGGVSFEGNAIYMDNEVYTWMNLGGGTYGFKFSEDTLSDEAADMTPEQMQQAEQIRSEMVFNCSPWTPDESLFELPAGVEFSTL